MPTCPLAPETISEGVAVPLSPTTNMGVFAPTVVVAGSIETKPQGEEVPMPTLADNPVANIVVPVAISPATFNWPEIEASPCTDKL